MSFVSFLGQVAKIGLGYAGGLVLLLTSMMLYIDGSSGLSTLLAIGGFVLLLFGVYSEREL